MSEITEIPMAMNHPCTVFILAHVYMRQNWMKIFLTPIYYRYLPVFINR